MLKFLCFGFLVLWLPMSSVWAEDKPLMEDMHVHFENGVVYCDVQSFKQEAYVLKVLGSGSPMTVFWQFELQRQRDFWLNKTIATVRLGRQVIPDLVTKRWLMRDLSGGVVTYTSDVQAAMRFLTEMNHAAVVDISILEQDSDYVLSGLFYMHEGEWEGDGWWSSLLNWGESLGEIVLRLPDGVDQGER